MGEDKKKEKKSKKKDKEAKKEEPKKEEPKEEPKKEEEAPKKEEPKRAQRGTSNVFALFNQSQIQEFKEAFQMMDNDRDGFLSQDDLAAIYQNTGRDPDPKTLKDMLAEAPGQINFTAFLTLFGEKMTGTDPEQTLRDAFKMFDSEGNGKLDEAYVKDLLMNTGDQFNKDEIKQTWKEAPIEGGKLDYLKFVLLIKRGPEDEQPAA